MNEAECYFERADTAEDSDWLHYVGAAEIQSETCHCLRDLKQCREALGHAQRAADSTVPEYARTLGFCRMVLTQSHLLNGELEAAGDTLQSARFQRYVTDFQAEVSRHAAIPAVAAFHEKVRDALARLDDD
ncbi:hypothetical protein ACIG3E_10350 [Streptomyces sp. NPDC053474]|uniref:hypothetical protein n=1 Tax=Streptomyces sp. NPDC053474 TaxID=3365704 RepID=UPI0037D42AA6